MFDSDSHSEAMIYQPAVASEHVDTNMTSFVPDANRLSPSSDEGVLNSSDETNGLIIAGIGQLEIDKRRKKSRFVEDGEEAHCSKDMGDKLEQRIRGTERSKVRIYEISGKQTAVNHIDKSYFQAVMIDNGYMTLGTHIDDNLKSKTEDGAYVDLTKLVPCDKVREEEDQSLEMINRGDSHSVCQSVKGKIHQLIHTSAGNKLSEFI